MMDKREAGFGLKSIGGKEIGGDIHQRRVLEMVNIVNLEIGKMV